MEGRKDWRYAMIEPTVERLIEVLSGMDYAVFTKGEYNTNLVFIRKDLQQTNLFDDTCCVFYRIGSEWRISYYSCTTDPGRYDQPPNPKGVAVMKPGQYRGAYKIGYHKGEYKALVQSGPVTVYRDRYNDGTLDYMEPETGMFGINVHRARPSGKSLQVDNWSQGCLVLNNSFEFDQLMWQHTKARDYYGNSFTLTLIEEKDF